MCFNKAKASQDSQVTDNRIGADNGGIAVHSVDADKVTFGSDETAQFAIEASTNALTTSTEFIGDALTSFFNLTDKRLESADRNQAAQQALTGSLLAKEQESSDDRLIKIFQYGILAFLGYAAIKSGAIKNITRAIK
ncbi:MAG: hypothetical protein COB36_11065 [Alphaproteobacteria bacterium]|nr:MAG: hypothetical protein COB36_11065 [Alphaproteobacteria bacterium]